MATFEPTARQREASQLLAGPQMHTLLYGGSRSGKTFLLVRAIAFRAIKAAKSRHAILRFHFNAVKQAIVLDTWPKVMELCFPGIGVDLDRTDWVARLANGSEIWFGGLDDKERTEKVLGKEYSTIFLNECSQIPWESRNVALTRLAQRSTQEIDGVRKPLRLRMLYDENPPSAGHWTHKLFIKRTDPETGKALPDSANYAAMQINPRDNRENLPQEYLSTLESMPARLRKRFLEGEFSDATPNALFPDDVVERCRHLEGELPDMQRIVIAVDPSGAGDETATEADDIGVVVAGLGVDGNAYVLEDLTVNAPPAVWGRIVGTAFDRHQADRVVAEVNFGGAMVQHVLKTARPRTPFTAVRASRGKVVRAEPVSALMEQGKVRIVGYLREMEAELSAFSTLGYLGDRSPNRADAMIWAVSELFPGLVQAPRQEKKRVELPARAGGATGWMA